MDDQVYVPWNEFPWQIVKSITFKKSDGCIDIMFISGRSMHCLGASNELWDEIIR
jgi:hypothetical protein